MLFARPLVELGKKRIHAHRAHFFDSIIWACRTPPGAIDDAMGQSEYFFPVVDEGLLNSPVMGTLMMYVKPSFHGQSFSYCYSIFQAGRTMKIGLLLSGGLEQAPLLDWHRELADLWQGTEPERFDRAGAVLYDWHIQVPGLFDDWLAQETYVLGMRHFHFRVLRIVHDYAKLVKEMSEEDAQQPGDVLAQNIPSSYSSNRGLPSWMTDDIDNESH
jgi:hypothetical protein